jgi:peroxiredoxin-like protein
MTPFPHHYATAASAHPDGDVHLGSYRLPPLATASPEEFGGPGDRWSPETLLVGAVAGCFVLTFRAVAAAAGLAWTGLTCEAEGTLDRADRVTRFTSVVVRATLHVPPGTDEDRARRLLERAEQACLITNSLTAATHLDAEVVVGAEVLV